MEKKQVNKFQLAQSANVGRPSLDAWLAGQLPIKPSPVQRVAKVLRVPFAELWGDAEALTPDAQTRLVQLETLARRMRDLGREVEELLEPEEEPARPAPRERRVNAAEELPPIVRFKRPRRGGPR